MKEFKEFDINLIPDEKEDVALWISTALYRAGFSNPAQLAARTELSTVTIYRAIRAATMPHKATLEKIRDVCLSSDLILENKNAQLRKKLRARRQACKQLNQGIHRLKRENEILAGKLREATGAVFEDSAAAHLAVVPAEQA